jgi:hypothetical protein
MRLSVIEGLGLAVAQTNVKNTFASPPRTLHASTAYQSSPGAKHKRITSPLCSVKSCKIHKRKKIKSKSTSFLDEIVY